MNIQEQSGHALENFCKNLRIIVQNDIKKKKNYENYQSEIEIKFQ